jgi:hypothetical protein
MAQNGLTAGNAAQLGMGVMSIALGTVFKNCFPAGTPVSTERGQKPIEEVQAGDRVWAYSLPTGQWTLRPVMETYEFVNEDFVELRIDGPDGEEDKITSTAGHPFWVISGEDLENRPRPEHITAAEQELRDDKSAIPGRWVDAQDLYPDDVLLLRNGREATIWNVEFYRESKKTYNFAVDDLHCYAVGQLAVLVHNGCASRELADDLSKTTPRPSANHQAAHIVPGGAFSNRIDDVARAIKMAQDKMGEFLPGMRNTAINGFWATAGHLGTHTNKFFLAMGEAFRDVGSAQGARNALEGLMQQINAGDFL